MVLVKLRSLHLIYPDGVCQGVNKASTKRYTYNNKPDQMSTVQ